MGLGSARLLSRTREQPSMEEQRRGHKLKKEFRLRVGHRGRDKEWRGWSGSERGKKGV